MGFFHRLFGIYYQIKEYLLHLAGVNHRPGQFRVKSGNYIDITCLQNVFP